MDKESESQIFDKNQEVEDNDRSTHLKFKAWEKNLRTQARLDNYSLFRNHLRRLDLPEKPKLMLEGTIYVIQALIAYATMDGRTSEQFLKMQQYNPLVAPDACYVFTFDLCGKAFARVLVDNTLVIPDLADLYEYPWNKYKMVGYNSVCISHPDWSPLTKKELEELEREVTDDLRFDYTEDELDFWFDSRADDSYLFVSVYDVADTD